MPLGVHKPSLSLVCVPFDPGGTLNLPDELTIVLKARTFHIKVQLSGHSRKLEIYGNPGSAFQHATKQLEGTDPHPPASHGHGLPFATVLTTLFVL